VASKALGFAIVYLRGKRRGGIAARVIFDVTAARFRIGVSRRGEMPGNAGLACSYPRQPRAA
jgi:hypothetical protein